MFVTRGAHLWVMWGTLFIPIFAYLIRLVFHTAPGAESIRPNWKLGFGLGLGFALLLWVFSWLLGWVGSYAKPSEVIMFLSSQGMTASEFFNATSLRRLNYMGSLLTLLAILIPAFALLFKRDKSRTMDDEVSSGVNHPLALSEVEGSPSHHFVLLLSALAAILVLAPEFVYLRDQFGYRINTVFKFYYQAWILWSLVAAFGVAYLFEVLRSWRDTLFRVIISLVIFAGLLYPIFGLMNKTNNFKPLYGFSLDDFDRIQRDNPDEAAAIDFLRTVPNGVIAEAVGDGYSSYARISANTGLQTVLGWPGHESQWRGSYEPQGSRREDMETLYATFRWEEAQAIMEKYDIRYIYVGDLERTSIRLYEDKFKERLKVIFHQDSTKENARGNVTIYEAP